MLALVKQAKTVEIKVTVPERSYRSTARALGLDPLDAQIRQVVFFDTPDLALNKAGVVVRARRSQGDPDDTVIKLRPVVPKDLPAEARRDAELRGRSRRNARRFRVLGIVQGRAQQEPRPSRRCSASARSASCSRPVNAEFYATHAPKGLELDQLSILGPLNVFKLKFVPEDFGRQTGRRVVAVSRRRPGARVVDQGAAVRGVPGRRGGSGVHDRSRYRPGRRAIDQDRDGTELLCRRGARRN